MSIPTNARELLLALGIGQFNATMIIQYMFIAPATTDPKSPPIMLLVKSIQQYLARLGYQVPQHGYLDHVTAGALTAVAGSSWQNHAWGDTVKAVLTAPRAASTLAAPVARASSPMGFIPSLPDVPGGMLTYAAGAAAAFYFLVHKKRR